MRVIVCLRTCKCLNTAFIWSSHTTHIIIICTWHGIILLTVRRLVIILKGARINHVCIFLHQSSNFSLRSIVVINVEILCLICSCCITDWLWWLWLLSLMYWLYYSGRRRSCHWLYRWVYSLLRLGNISKSGSFNLSRLSRSSRRNSISDRRLLRSSFFFLFALCFFFLFAFGFFFLFLLLAFSFSRFIYVTRY